MGLTAEVRICFGILLQDYAELPWKLNEESTWWQNTLGFQPTFDPYEIRKGRVEYKKGVTQNDPRVNDHYYEVKAWLAEHPFPVSLGIYTSDEQPTTVIAVIGTLYEVCWGCPRSLVMKPTPAPAAIEVVTTFVEKYVQPLNPDLTLPPPAWIVGSYVSQ